MNANDRPPTPGEVLVREFLIPHGITQSALAEHTKWTRKHINAVCCGRVGVTVDTALILARALGTEPEFWLVLQAEVDIWDALHADSEKKARIERVEPLVLAA